MSQLLRPHRRLALSLVVLCTAAALLLGLPSVSQAVKTGHDVVCYSDASHTKEIGYHYYCINNSGGWGIISGPYCVTQVYPCT
jgi:hypothetical protein